MNGGPRHWLLFLFFDREIKDKDFERNRFSQVLTGFSTKVLHACKALYMHCLGRAFYID